MPLRICGLLPGRFGEIAEINNRRGSGDAPWSAEQAQAVLCDMARERGATTRLVFDGDRLVGCAALVTLGAERHEFYISPYLALSAEPADSLLLAMVRQAEARRALLLRTTVMSRDHMLAIILTRRAFRPTFDFIELSLDVSEAGAACIERPCSLRRISLAAVVPNQFAALHNVCFAGEENAPPIDADMARSMLEPAQWWTEASGVWVDDDGEYRAFVLCGGAGEIDAIGVVPGLRRRGIGASLLATTVRDARRRGVERLYAVVAEPNVASLALHRSLGFRELARRTTWQRHCEPCA